MAADEAWKGEAREKVTLSTQDGPVVLADLATLGERDNLDDDLWRRRVSAGPRGGKYNLRRAARRSVPGAAGARARTAGALGRHHGSWSVVGVWLPDCAAGTANHTHRCFAIQCGTTPLHTRTAAHA